MELDKVVKEIIRLRSLIHTENLWNSPTRLSAVMGEIGIYNNYLADHIAVLHKEATDDAYQKFKANEHHGATKAKEYSKGQSTQTRYLYEKAKNLYGATENLLSLLQSRIRVLENEVKGRM